MPTSSDPTSLYRFSDEHGRLLYVGITRRGRRRFEEHEADKAWWPLVALIEIEHHPDRITALAAEERAIRTEHPAFNLEHRADGGAAQQRRRKMRRGRVHIPEATPIVDWDRRMVEGTVESWETVPQIDDAGTPLLWDNGQPKRQVTIVLQTDAGRRAVHIRGGQMQEACREAIQATGRPGLEIGGELELMLLGSRRAVYGNHTHDPDETVYGATYRPPTPAIAAVPAESHRG